MLRSRRRRVLSALVLATLAVTASTAIGGRGVKSTVTLDQITTKAAKGKVKAKSGKCVSGRRVLVVYDLDGSTYASARTGKKGRWVVTDAGFLRNEKFHAKVAAKRVGGTTCKTDKSPSVVVK